MYTHALNLKAPVKYWEIIVASVTGAAMMAIVMVSIMAPIILTFRSDVHGTVASLGLFFASTVIALGGAIALMYFGGHYLNENGKLDAAMHIGARVIPLGVIACLATYFVVLPIVSAILSAVWYVVSGIFSLIWAVIWAIPSFWWHQLPEPSSELCIGHELCEANVDIMFNGIATIVLSAVSFWLIAKLIGFLWAVYQEENRRW